MGTNLLLVVKDVGDGFLQLALLVIVIVCLGSRRYGIGKS